MEPVSLAIGVVPLAITIIKLSSTIRDKVSIYKSADSDIETIIEKLDFVVGICQHLEETQDPLNDRQPPRLRDRALSMCYASIASIDLELDKVAQKTDGRKKKIEWLLRKSTFEKLLAVLNESIDMLTMYMNCQNSVML